MNYYISPTGNDTNDGLTVGGSFKTFVKAFTVMSGGDTLFMIAGTYNQSLGTNANPIPNGVDNLNRTKIIAIGNVILDAQQIRANNIKQFNNKNITIEAQTGFTIRLLNATERSMALTNFSSNLGNLTYRNIVCNMPNGIDVFHLSSSPMPTTNILIEDCEIELGGAGYGTDGFEFYNINDSVIRRCVAYNMVSNGFEWYGAENWIVEDCSSNNNGEAGFNVDDTLLPTRNIVFRNCESHNNKFGFNAVFGAEMEIQNGCNVHDNQIAFFTSKHGDKTVQLIPKPAGKITISQNLPVLVNNSVIADGYVYNKYGSKLLYKPRNLRI